MKRRPFDLEYSTQPLIDYRQWERGQGVNWYEIDPNLQSLVRKYTPEDDRSWCVDKLRHFGGLCGGAFAERAELTDKNPPRLERYDPWGDEVNRVIHHPAAVATKRELWEAGYTYLRVSPQQPNGRPLPGVLGAAYDYLLSQADSGMVCAAGMTAGIGYLIEQHAEEEVKRRFLPHITCSRYEDAMDGAMFMTERTGGSDLSTISTTARRHNGRWLLNGPKWFCSNVDAALIVTLARPEESAHGLDGLALFLVPRIKADGRPNGIRIRRLKDKLGTRTVPTAEVDFVEAEAYLLGEPPPGTPTHRGLQRMMEMVTLSRLGVAAMGLGIARRSFLEAAIYTARRTAFGKTLNQFPMIRETLVRMLVEVEAVAALYFAASLTKEDPHRQRLMIPLAKFRATRLGLEAASLALEMHGGNGYIENWPTARLLRDAQCHTIWEGTENIICLDVLRSLAKEKAQEALLMWIELVLENTRSPLLAEPCRTLRRALDEVRETLVFLAQAGPEMSQFHARRITQFLADLTQAALLLEEAEWEITHQSSARKALVAALFLESHFAMPPRRGIGVTDRTVLEEFERITGYARIPLDEASPRLVRRNSV